MRWSSVGLLVSIAALCAGAAPIDPVDKTKLARHEDEAHNETAALLHKPVAQHHHAHLSHMIAMEHLNETARELKFGPRVQSYLRYDLGLPVPKPVLEENLAEWEILQEQFGSANHEGHGKMMAAHCLLLMFAFFVALPISMILRATKHTAHHFVFGGFVATSVLGCIIGGMYRQSSPDLYVGSSHGLHGFLAMMLCMSIAAIDHMRMLVRGYPRLRNLLTSSKSDSEKEAMLDDFQKPGRRWAVDWEQPPDYARPSESDDDTTCIDNDPLAIPTAERVPYADSESLRSDVGDISTAEPQTWRFKVSSVVSLCHKIFFRIVMLAVAYYLTCSGVVTYLGYAQRYLFLSIVGHVIPASIVLLFHSLYWDVVEGGWAWSPSGRRYHGPSLEMVGCVVIVIYGVIALEEELRAYDSSDPRQLQHMALNASMAFTAATGVLLESNLVKRLAASLKESTAEIPRQCATNPSSSIAFSIAGLLMLGHPQHYTFSVSMHKHWGLGFVLASVFRFISCALSWTGSQDPQRIGATHYPPTEFLASFTYATSGLMVMLSINEVGFDAMRLGFDDATIFLCVSAAMTALIFLWILVLKVIGAWALNARQKVCTL